jgi:putative sigma-54 modulation protein
MQITYTGHGLEVTDALRDLVNSKFERVKHHCEHITSAHVTFNVQKREHHAEMTLHIPGLEVNAKGISDDMYKAIDDMIHKIDKQLIRHKEKERTSKVLHRDIETLQEPEDDED